jgi:hypothetical protein
MGVCTRVKGYDGLCSMLKGYMGLYARVVGIYGPVCTYCRDIWACMHVL